MKLTTTYQLLRQHDACDGRYDHLKRNLKERGHRGAIPLSLILEINGLDDALWALVAVPRPQKAERDLRARLFACDCAERVLPLYEAKYPEDNHARSSIECARLFANGEATADELAAAGDAVGDAVGAAAWAAARAAARSWQNALLLRYLDGELGEVE